MTAGHGDEAAARDWPQVPGYRVNRAGDRDDAGAWFTARSVVTHDEVRIRHLTQPTERTIGDVGAASRLAPLPVEIVDLAEAGVAAVYPIAEVVTLTDVLAGVGLLTAGQTAWPMRFAAVPGTAPSVSRPSCSIDRAAFGSATAGWHGCVACAPPLAMTRAPWRG